MIKIAFQRKPYLGSKPDNQCGQRDRRTTRLLMKYILMLLLVTVGDPVVSVLCFCLSFVLCEKLWKVSQQVLREEGTLLR